MIVLPYAEENTMTC